MVEKEKRVWVWNTFLVLARSQAKKIFEKVEKCKAKDEWSPSGGTLPDLQVNILGTLVLCILAIESRANHLIEELLEQGRITDEVAKAAKRLPIKEKWFFLPALIGKPHNTLSSSEGPHQAIAELCDLRNETIHVSYDAILKNLPNHGKMLSLFRGFVEAMEDLNVVLGRHTEVNRNVLKIGIFEKVEEG